MWSGGARPDPAFGICGVCLSAKRPAQRGARQFAVLARADSIVYPQARATAAIRAFVDWSSRSRGRICRNEQPRQSVEVSSPASRSESAGQVVPKEKRRCFPTTLCRKCPCIQGFQRTQKEEVAAVPERVVTAGRLANGTGTCRAVRSTVVHHSTKTDRK